MTITLPELASAIIGCFEGCQLTAYKDTGGVWTIGWGHTGPEVCEGLSINQDHADLLLAQDQAPIFKMVAAFPLLAAAGYVSFAYNCGQGALARLLASASLPDGDAMKVTMDQFVHSGNVVQPGLVRRRRLEAMLVTLGMQQSA